MEFENKSVKAGKSWGVFIEAVRELYNPWRPKGFFILKSS